MPTSSRNTNRTMGGNNMNNNCFTFEELSLSIARNIVAIQNGTANTNGNMVSADGYTFARTSRFYNQVMADGTIYNPYLNRRWLPQQFLALMRNYDGNVDKGIKKRYDYKYMIKWVVSEVNKLAYLEKHDPIAFAERSKFLTIADVQYIMRDYCVQLRNALEKAKQGKGHTKLNKEFYATIPGSYYFKMGKYTEEIQNHRVVRVLIKSDEYKRILNKIKYFESDINNTYWRSNKNYQNLADILNGFKFIPIRDGVLPWILVDRYKKAGAYYTLKNLVLFEGVNVSTYDGVCSGPIESADKLKTIQNMEGYKIYSILKRSIRDSRFDIHNR